MKRGWVGVYNRAAMKSTASQDRDESLYETDFHAWTQRTAALLRAGRFNAIEIEHAAEEVEDMGKREAKELDSRVRVCSCTF